MSNLIIYFSRAGSNWVENDVAQLKIGNTELLAKFLQTKIGGDLFKIETDKIYPDEYYACTEEVKNEVKNNIFPNIINCISNIDKYDTIYIGHPIWWDNLPNVVIGFLNKFNWQDKIIYPFCTHEGSGIANSEKTIKSICKNATIKPYFEIRGYKCQNIDNDTNEKIENWLKQ